MIGEGNKMISTRTTISVFAILFRLRVERKNSCQFSVEPSREQKSFFDFITDFH